jgi:hypothetical protein
MLSRQLSMICKITVLASLPVIPCCRPRECPTEAAHSPEQHSGTRSPNSQRIHQYSRRQTGETGQFGKVTLVDMGDDTPSLAPKLRQQLELAQIRNERCLFLTMVPGCPTCASLGYAISSGALGHFAGRVRVVRIDLDEFESEVKELNLPIDRVPGFFQIDSTGKVLDFLDASEWRTNNPAEFGPIIAKFLDGRLERRHHPWIPKVDSRAIDL